MNRKIGILLTSIERDKSFFKAIQSILDNLQDNWMIIIGYQGHKEITFSHHQIYCYNLPYNCGISYARNDMIQKAYGLGCDYILLTADSILFNDSIQDLNFIIHQMEKDSYDLCGLNLQNRVPWEGMLKLIPNESFEIDFIDPKSKELQLFVPCDIVRNFWVANLQSVGRCGYDNDLIMAEHEDFYYRFKEAGFKVCCTNMINGLYVKEQNDQYNKIRKENFKIGQQRLLKKYNLKSWITYKNIDRIQGWDKS